jgi:hypothetical protein
MKVGKQTPVHKGGEMIVNNYRPITVCSSIAKILIKVVRDRVMTYLDSAKILNKSQFGFKSKHNTNHAVINLTESTLEALEKDLKVGGVCLDIAKAFDSVKFDILLRKLEYYGFRANTLMWFESYLKIENNTSLQAYKKRALRHIPTEMGNTTRWDSSADTLCPIHE